MEKKTFHDLLFSEDTNSKSTASSPGPPQGGRDKSGIEKSSSNELECQVCKKCLTPPIVICKNLHYMCLNCRTNPSECPICKKVESINTSARKEKNVPRELECPLCLDTMTAPILMCVNGHSICGRCRRLLNHCPTCGQSFLNIRNRALESLAQNIDNITANIDSLCINAPFGCKVSMTPSDVKAHKEVCLYRPRKCPLSKSAVSACDFNDTYFKLKSHIESEHKDRITSFDNEKKVHMKHFDCSKKCSRVLFASNEIFYQQFEVKNDIFYFVVQHVVPGNSRKKYTYNLSINGINLKRNEGISVVSKAHNFEEDIDQIYSSGECAMIHFNMIKNFMEGKDVFEFTIEIIKDGGKNKQVKNQGTLLEPK